MRTVGAMKRRKRSMVSLPYDVHVEIIAWVYRNSQHVDIDYRTLSACSLVCKEWTAPSLRLLFRNANSRFLRHSHTLLLLNALRENALLGTYVYFIKIKLSINSVGDTDNALALLALCPNLETLSVVASSDPSDMTSQMERIRGMGLRVKHLQFANTPKYIPPFLGLWPDLQSLDIFTVFVESALPEHPAPWKTPRSAAVTWRSPVSARWLLEAADTSALRELEVSGVDWGNSLCLRTFHRTPALENLTSLFLDGALPPQAIIVRFLRLEKLVFAVCPAGAVVLPRTLRHVGYHAVTKDDGRVPVWYLRIALQGLPVLRLVTTRDLSTTDLEDLTRACEFMWIFPP
ncbi:hypothetical protein FA95DRAFT_1609517 [Auriscalpium vulgare]|uniref:Uncharacterized protein n=1 Tax=Auriscalpium vulgare TaxID=40419 RepID=A0ACB8RGE7_9AGAM|nr:hypothetical protein FA95DRAFT_1609517 [Auriscalpium vulgare]